MYIADFVIVISILLAGSIGVPTYYTWWRLREDRRQRDRARGIGG